MCRSHKLAVRSAPKKGQACKISLVAIDMIQAVLFDLDNTLLVNDTHKFMRGYLALLRQHVPPEFDADHFVQELLHCTQLMMTSQDTAVSNRDTFWTAFSQRLDSEREGLERHFDQFYQEQFPHLQTLTEMNPQTAELVQLCFQNNLKVVIATNPVYPRQAIEHRLAWAGVPITAFNYALVTDYENMHATKPHGAYYEEILTEIGYTPEDVLMVGDSWENDMVPAAQLGMFTYWLPEQGQEPPTPEMITAYGSLGRLHQLLASGWLQ